VNKKETNIEQSNSPSPEKKTGKVKRKRTLLQKIVNVFLYTGVGLLILLLVFLGVSQTSAFREFLREKIVETANETLNGTLSIEKLDGTIFTSLLLTNTVVNIGSDTLLNSKTIGLKISPLQLLLQKIFVREIELTNTSINITSDNEGVLNILKLFFPSEKEFDTTASKFPFTIEIAALELKNIDFIFQSYDKTGSTGIYDELNTDDIRIKNLSLALSVEADINKNNYKLALHHISMQPNIRNFNLKNLSGMFLINDESIAVRDFKLQTGESDVAINLMLNDFNLFNPEGIDLSTADINLDAFSEVFSFDDLKAIVPQTDLLHGKTAFRLSTEGSFSELNINSLLVQLPNSQIEGSGRLTDLNKPESMFMNFNLSGSYIDQEDINNLLPGLELTLYPEYGVIRFDSLLYAGEPLEFESNVNILTDKGEIAGLIKLNLKEELLGYDFALRLNELDLFPVMNVKTGLNLSADIKGKGTSPDNLDMNLNIIANGSTYNGNSIDTLKIIASAGNKNITYDLHLFSDITFADVSGELDFTDEENPLFKINGIIRDLNIARVTGDTALQTNLNFSLDAEGESFNPDNMNLFLILSMYESSVMDTRIDSTRAIVDLRKGNGEERVINFISDIADITLTGEFVLAEAIDLLSSQAEFLSSSFTAKMSLLFPSMMSESPVETAGLKIKEPLFTKVENPVNINYIIELKDFSLLSAFININQFEVDGEMGGTVKSSDNNVLISFNSNINYIRYWSDEDVFLIQNLQLETGVSNNFDAASTYDLDINSSVYAERIFAGSEINDLNFSLNMSEDIARINFSAESVPLYSKVNGEIDISKDILSLNIDSLKVSYNQYLLENRNRIGIVYTEDKIEINNFNLVHDKAELTANGFLAQNGNQNLKLLLKDFSGYDLSTKLLRLEPKSSLMANINLKTDVTGSLSDPKIIFDMSVDSVSYMDKNFGSLTSSLSYFNKNLDIDIKFTDSLFNPTQPALVLTGNYPVDLSFGSSSVDNSENAPMEIRLKSDGFNLGAFGDVLPAVKRLRGMLTSDLTLTGSPSDIYASGYLKVNNAAFILAANNLKYNASLVVRVEGNQLNVDSIMIANASGTQFGGRMLGSGSAVLDNFEIVSSKFAVNGDLKVLSDASKSVTPAIYGDLVIGTKGNLEIQIDSERIFLRAPVIVKRARLTLPQTQSAYSGAENYVYKYPEDTTKEKEIDFETLVDLARQQEIRSSPAGKASTFDFLVDVEIEDEITVVFVLSREFNQNLTAVLKGNVTYSRFGGRSDVQGRLEFLDGSTLEFIKTLAARGSIIFEGDLTNPFLDIEATYRDYYLPLSGPDAGKEVEVAVKLILEGTLKDLNKKLVQSERHLKVYYGAESIENNLPSLQYDASDAAMFILLGKFNNDADQQDRNAVASYATGLAGSLVGGFLNNQFGDIIKGVELRQVGSTTVVNILGRVGKFRYEIGTSTYGYQDLSRTNVKIEYPVTRRFFLNVKRKEPVSSEASYIGEMINEFGLKYRFEF
jgi:hypothetical protein